MHDILEGKSVVTETVVKDYRLILNICAYLTYLNINTAQALMHSTTIGMQLPWPDTVKKKKQIADHSQPWVLTMVNGLALS